MNDDQTLITPEEAEEKEYRKFVRRLLDAQRPDFPEGDEQFDDSKLFSVTTLRQTFCKFCDIIADELGTESCTIHLQLYDPETVDPEDPPFDERLEEVARSYYSDLQDPARSAFTDRRRRLWGNSQTFPYWWHRKGASVLFASNRKTSKNSHGAAWTKVALLKKLGVAPLEKGVSKDIYQEHIARIRDHRSIQSTRNFRKLGGLDVYAWTNTRWEEIFRNYYGVPIRIHSLGEALGILKVENKKEFSPDANTDKGGPSLDQILAAKDPTSLEKRILQHVAASQKELGKLHTSLLSLAYLKADLRTAECKAALDNGVTLKDLIFTPFPHIDYGNSLGVRSELRDLYDADGSSHTADYDKNDLFHAIEEAQNHCQSYSSLRPSRRKIPPPMQVFTENVHEEHNLWHLLGVDLDLWTAGDQATASLDRIQASTEVMEKLLISVENLYRHLERCSPKMRGRLASAHREIPEITRLAPFRHKVSWRKAAKYRFICTDRERLPPYHLEVEISKIRPRSRLKAKVLVMLPPTPDSLQGAERACNTWWCEGGDILAKLRDQLPNLDYQGELVALRRDSPATTAAEDSTPGVQRYFISFAVDRLAARSQAFARSLATAEFDNRETRKISWAALEIGKVLEREIAYRANLSRPPIPLTATEFYRLPISHLGFVDDLRRRRHHCEKVEREVQHRLEQVILDFGWRNSARASSRVKAYRSYLRRLGERYEGFIRGNMALGFFLLSLLPDLDPSPGTTTPPGTMDKLRSDLRKIREEVEALYPSSDFEFFKEVGGQILGDLRFRAPLIPESDSPRRYLTVCLDNLTAETFLPLFPDRGFWARQLKCLVEGSRQPAATRSVSSSRRLRSHRQEPSNAQVRQELEDLLFRQYDGFAQATYSLLCQCANLLYLKKTDSHRYRRFYRACLNLKDQLCRPSGELPPRLRDLFVGGTVWRSLVEYLDDHDTSHFAKELNSPQQDSNGSPPPDQDVLFLNPRGLYKRIRMMHNVLRRHTTPASLERSLRRFDLVGCRATTLFRHQVFALSDYLWSRGDPFFSFQLEKDQYTDFRKEGKALLPPWLCLRTRVIEGEYQAVHIVALVDAQGVGEARHQERTFNFKDLRQYLGSRLEKDAAQKYQREVSRNRKCILKIPRHYLGGDVEASFATRYQKQSYRRNQMRLEAQTWPEREGSDQEEASGVQPSPKDSAFLFEGVIDLVTAILAGSTMQKGKLPSSIPKLTGGLDHALRDVGRWGRRYTREFKTSLIDGIDTIPRFNCKANANSDICRSCQAARESPSELDRLWQRPGPCQIYRRAAELIKELQVLPAEVREDLAKYLTSEEDAFSQLATESSSANARQSTRRMPLFFATREPPEDPLEFLADLKRQFGELFFDAGEEESSEGGLWMRDEQEVLNRIENYILTFSREDREEHPDWTAYDLFHYFHGLIPVEFQVRTRLANTVAEQYHGPLYKGERMPASEFGRQRVERLSRQLADWDLEMDRVYLAVRRLGAKR